jgi:hypothetical protein
MFVFIMPLIVVCTLLGCFIGAVVGRKLWGNPGGVLLGMVLGLARPWWACSPAWPCSGGPICRIE